MSVCVLLSYYTYSKSLGVSHVAIHTCRLHNLPYMLNKLFKKPLELKIGDQTLQFNSVSDIAFCLEGRTSISSAKLSELFKLSKEELETQAQKLADLNKTMFTILNSIVDEPDNIDRSMRELDTQMFSQDQNWRDIIQSLNKEQGEINTIRVTVIMKYMKYLSALEDTIGYIRSERKKFEGAVASDNENKLNDFEETWSLSQLREEVKQSAQAEHDFKRIPKDQTVSVMLPPGKRLDVRLASYPCQLVATDGNVQFINDSGATILNKGSNVVGRSTKSTVKIDAAQKHVSRSHLVIQLSDGNALQLTDHSSEGTFIASDMIN
jgi:FHA domain-containing protein